MTSRNIVRMFILFHFAIGNLWLLKTEVSASLKYRMLIVFHVIIDLPTFWHRCINLIHWYAAKIFYQSSFPYLSYLYIFVLNISVHLVNFFGIAKIFQIICGMVISVPLDLSHLIKMYEKSGHAVPWHSTLALLVNC